MRQPEKVEERRRAHLRCTRGCMHCTTPHALPLRCAPSTTAYTAPPHAAARTRTCATTIAVGSNAVWRVDFSAPRGSWRYRHLSSRSAGRRAAWTRIKKRVLRRLITRKRAACCALRASRIRCRINMHTARAWHAPRISAHAHRQHHSPHHADMTQQSGALVCYATRLRCLCALINIFIRIARVAAAHRRSRLIAAATPAAHICHSM